MTHAYGIRSGTRHKFSKGFRQRGVPNLSRYLTVFKRGDYVTIKADGAIQKGMPHSFYHGRTGVIYDVTKRAVGVEIPKRVGNREILKRFHVRIEHVFKSRCNEEFRNRMAANAMARKAHKESGSKEPLDLKRKIAGPRGAVKVVPAEGQLEWMSPLKFEESF